MTPLDLARNLAASDNPMARAMAVAMVARGLSDHDPSNPTRQPWPLDVSIIAATEYLHLDPDPALIRAATDMAPTLSNALLNYREEVKA